MEFSVQQKAKDAKEKENPANGPTIMSLAAKSEPLIVKVFGPAVVFTQIFPKTVKEVAVNVGVVTTTPHNDTGLELFLGFGVAIEKSAKLLFVSSQPLLLRKAALKILKVSVGAVSEHTVAVP